MIDRAVANLIVETSSPETFIESQGFKNFMAVVEPDYAIPSSEITLKRLEAEYEEKKEEIRNVLESASSVCLTSDFCTAESNVSYLGVRANFIDNNWVPKSFALVMEEMETSQTAENLAAKISEVTDDWNVS